MCVVVRDALDKYKIKYELYHIDREFNSINIKLKEDECILYFNYFGMFSEKRIRKIISKYKNVIIDNTQALFCTA